MDKLELIKKTFPFLEKELILGISEASTLFKLQADQSILGEGDYIKSFPMVLEGCLRVLRLAEDGNEFMMVPVLEQLKSKMADKLKILKVDVDNNRERASKYNIRSVPTLMLFQDGKTKWSGVGVMTSNYLENVVNNNSSVVSN